MTDTTNTVAIAELARIFADSEGRLDRLVAAGRIEEVEPGRVGLVAAVRTFLADLKADLAASTGTAAAEAAREARASATALRLAERRREVIEVDQVDTAIDFVCGAINSTLTALPARTTRDMRVRRKVDEIVFNLRDRIAREIGAVE